MSDKDMLDGIKEGVKYFGLSQEDEQVMEIQWDNQRTESDLKGWPLNQCACVV